MQPSEGSLKDVFYQLIRWVNEGRRNPELWTTRQIGCTKLDASEEDVEQLPIFCLSEVLMDAARNDDERLEIVSKLQGGIATKLCLGKDQVLIDAGLVIGQKDEKEERWRIIILASEMTPDFDPQSKSKLPTESFEELQNFKKALRHTRQENPDAMHVLHVIFANG